MRGRSLKKSGGQEAQALGRSRGGFSTKVHIAVDALGNPLRLILTAGQRHDSPQAFNDVMMDAVIEGLDNYQSMASQVLGNERVKKGFTDLLLNLVYQAFQKRADSNQKTE